jgi:hypothetical protein
MLGIAESDLFQECNLGACSFGIGGSTGQRVNAGEQQFVEEEKKVAFGLRSGQHMVFDTILGNGTSELSTGKTKERGSTQITSYCRMSL